MCKMNKWQYLPPDLWFLKWIARGASSPSADFGRLRKTSDFFGNLRKWSCRLQKSQHFQDKNLTLISQKKLAGIHLSSFVAGQGTLAPCIFMCFSINVQTSSYGFFVSSFFFSDEIVFSRPNKWIKTICFGRHSILRKKKISASFQF